MKKSALFLLAIGITQLALYHVIDPVWIDFPVFIAARKSMRHGRSPVLYLGDSVVSTFAPEDRDQSTIAEMVARLSSLPVANLASPGYGTDLHADLLGYALAAGRPRAAVVPVNLRILCPYHRALEGAKGGGGEFAREKVFLKYARYPVLYPFVQGLLIFKAFDLDAPTERLPLPTQPERKTITRLLAGEIPDSERFELLYGCELDSHDPNFSAVSRIAELAKTSRIPIIVYITPLPYDPSYSSERVRANIERVRNTLPEPRITFLDLSRLVPKSDFLNVEHLREPGRRAVAERVAEALSRSLKD